MCEERLLFFGQKCDKDKQEDRQEDRHFYRYNCGIFFRIHVAKDCYSYYVTFAWTCNVALWDVSLLLSEGPVLLSDSQSLRLTRPRYTLPASLFTLVWFAIIVPHIRIRSGFNHAALLWRPVLHARTGEASCTEPPVLVIHGMASKQTYSSGSEKRNKKKLDEEQRSQDKGKIVFHDVGGGGALMLNFYLASVFALGKG